MPNKILTPSCSALTLVLGLALSTGPAYAGFQWVAPTDNAPYSPSGTNSYISSSPPVVRAPEKISPLVMPKKIEVPQQAVEAPPAAANSPTSLVFSPKEETKADLATATISMPAASGETASGAAVVQGFATQVPLTLALRQLLPIGYSFSISQGVDTNTYVSYKGGRPWDETLKEMLASVGLVDRKQGTVVTISLCELSASGAEPKSPASQMAPLSTAPARTTGAMNNLKPPAGGMPEISAINVLPADGWSADRGTTLRKVLTEWCKRAEVELKWLAEYDYPIEASAHFNGSFEDAVRNLLAGFDSAQPQPVGELHANPNASQKILVIQARGNSNSN